MQRRKFIAGLGSLTAAGAAGIGTGAFTSVSADRSVAVTTADDSDALLAMDAKSTLANSAYADETGSAISIDLNNDDLNGASNGAATGVNTDGTTKILSIFEVQNQGTQNVFVYVDPDDITPQSVGEDGSAPVFIDPQASDLPHRTSYPSASSLSLTSVGLDDAEIESHNRDEFPAEAGYYEPEDFTLAPGESFDFGLYIEHDGTGSWTGSVTLPITASAEHAADLENTE